MLATITSNESNAIYSKVVEANDLAADLGDLYKQISPA